MHHPAYKRVQSISMLIGTNVVFQNHLYFYFINYNKSVWYAVRKPYEPLRHDSESFTLYDFPIVSYLTPNKPSKRYNTTVKK